jgi:hypothetical protein
MFLHHLPGLSGDVVAADQRSGRVDGILPADVNGRRSRRNDGDLAECGAREEPSGRISSISFTTATLFNSPTLTVMQLVVRHLAGVSWWAASQPSTPAQDLVQQPAERLNRDIRNYNRTDRPRGGCLTPAALTA